MGNLTPYNLVVIVAGVVVLAIGAVVFIFAAADQSERYVVLATPVLLAIVGLITAYQNRTNHEENQARLSDLEDRLPPK